MKLRAFGWALVFVAGAAQADGRLAVHDAWIRAMPPGATMAAGYATLSNDGDAPVTILSAQSDAFRNVTLHETIVSGDVAKMREVHRLVVAPGATIKLEPGGRHAMKHCAYTATARHPLMTAALVVGASAAMAALMRHRRA